MVNGTPPKWLRPAPGTWLARRLARRAPHPDAFDCGVRVVAGTVAGERAQWRFEISAVDPYVRAGIHALRHGDVDLPVQVDGAELGAPPVGHPGHVVFAARVRDARIEVCVPAGELVRFGLG